MNRAELVDAVQMAELSSDFEILPHDVRFYMLHTGDLAKVCAPFPMFNGFTGERFWIEITAAEPGKYCGRIANDLEHTERHGYKKGDSLDFTHHHIYQIAHRSMLSKPE